MPLRRLPSLMEVCYFSLSFLFFFDSSLSLSLSLSLTLSFRTTHPFPPLHTLPPLTITEAFVKKHNGDIKIFESVGKSLASSEFAIFEKSSRKCTSSLSLPLSLSLSHSLSLSLSLSPSNPAYTLLTPIYIHLPSFQSGNSLTKVPSTPKPVPRRCRFTMPSPLRAHPVLP